MLKIYLIGDENDISDICCSSSKVEFSDTFTVDSEQDALPPAFLSKVKLKNIYSSNIDSSEDSAIEADPVSIGGQTLSSQ